jgi:hypothetical protein
VLLEALLYKEVYSFLTLLQNDFQVWVKIKVLVEESVTNESRDISFRKWPMTFRLEETHQG